MSPQGQRNSLCHRTTPTGAGLVVATAIKRLTSVRLAEKRLGWAGKVFGIASTARD